MDYLITHKVDDVVEDHVESLRNLQTVDKRFEGRQDFSEGLTSGIE